MTSFDPYQQWLGIPDAIGTPNHYRLLGLRLFEDLPPIISTAAARLTESINKQLSGPYASEARRVLGEIETARTCLLNPSAKQEYDAALRQQLSRAPLNPLATSSRAPPLDPLPATSMAWRGAAAGVPLPPSSAPPMPPAAPVQDYVSAAPRSEDASWRPAAAHAVASSPLPPMPPGTGPTSPPDDALLPPTVTGADLPMPLPPGSYMSSQAPAPTPVYAAAAPMHYPPAAIPIAAAATPPAALAIPIAVPAPIATPVYAAPVYSAPTAVPIAQPVAAHIPTTAPPASYAEEPAIVAPRPRPSWRYRKPPTAGLLLGSVTAVLIVLAVIVVAANRPDLVQRQENRSGEVANSERIENSPVSEIPDKEPISRPSPAPPDRQPTTARKDNDVAMSNKPTPIDPPAPKPPAPAPPTPAPAVPDAQKDEAVAKALNLARLALSKNDPRTAHTHVASARAAMASNRTDEIDRVEALAKNMEDFNKAVREGVKNLQVGGQLAVSTVVNGKSVDTFVGVVEVQSESVIFKVQGQNKTYPIATMPRDLAYALAKSWLREDSKVTKLILGTYQAMHANGDRAKARELWQAAAAEQLLPELSVPLPKDTGAGALTEDAKPGADGRLPLPLPAVQSQARTEVRQMFEADYADAKDAVTKAALATKLLERAEQPSDTSAVRYILLLEAGKLAAEAGDFERMTVALDKLAERYAADAIALKADALLDVSKTAEGKEAKALATAALDLYDEAVLSEKFDAAVKIAGTAKSAARKSGDSDLIKEWTLRDKQAKDLKK